jgi:glutathione peroxidase
MTSALYDIPLRRLNGQAARLGDYAGQVLLIVNVASQCGLTPQYTELEALFQRFGAQGLQVLGFPCNDFAAQEPGSADEIQSFCAMNYGVSFPMFDKVSINSAPRHPLYAALIEAQPVALPSGSSQLHDILAAEKLLPPLASDVMWNFEKFLVGRDGTVRVRFAPDVAPDDARLLAAIEAALAA